MCRSECALKKNVEKHSNVNQIMFRAKQHICPRIPWKSILFMSQHVVQWPCYPNLCYCFDRIYKHTLTHTHTHTYNKPPISSYLIFSLQKHRHKVKFDDIRKWKYEKWYFWYAHPWIFIHSMVYWIFNTHTQSTIRTFIISFIHIFPLQMLWLWS